jgi:L-aminopeptidase/D-esterase-like protein
VITDVAGVRVGHADDPVALTGCTVVLCETPATCAVERRGRANDVVGLDHLDPRHVVSTVDALVLGGGSRFGEAVVAGIMRYLEERGIGRRFGGFVIPHVAGAFLFDLGVGDGRVRPSPAMGYDAARRAGTGPVAEGSVGAGTGATVGKLHGIARAMRGGIGSASARCGEAVVGALVAVNAVGDVRDPESGALVAGTRDAPDGRRLVDSAREIRAGLGRFATAPATATTIGVVATDARLTKVEAAAVASLGMLGFARALSPPHTDADGDALFVLSIGERRADLTGLGLAAAEAVAAAIVSGVRAADSRPGLPAASDLR